MTRRITLSAVAATLLVAVATNAALAFGTGGFIVNSAHNFSGKAWNSANKEICQPCHTPHHSYPSDISKRMWNHKLTEAMYIPHEGALHENPADPTEITNLGSAASVLDKPSRLCMSCHDGTVALDAFGHLTDNSVWNEGNAGNKFSATDIRNLGTDLSNDHPVGMEAPYPQESTSFKDSTNTTTFKLRLVDTGVDLTYKDRSGNTWHTTKVVGCTSCHNAHGSGDSGSTVPYPNLLRIKNEASAVCLTCHVK